MRKLGIHLTTFTLVALIAVQASGVHLHAESGDHDGKGSHGIHVEQTLFLEHEPSDHDGHVDLSLADTPLTFTSIDYVIHNTLSCLAPVVPSIEKRWRGAECSAPPRRDLRLRPPLRAPPAHA